MLRATFGVSRICTMANWNTVGWYGCFQKVGYPPIIHYITLIGVFHCKPSILGYKYPYCWKKLSPHISDGFHPLVWGHHLWEAETNGMWGLVPGPFAEILVGYLFGGFLKWWYPQNTPKWSFLVGNPWLLGTTIFGNPHLVTYHSGRRTCNLWY